MSDIFVSYSRTDVPRVAGLVRCLEGQGWSVFWDQNIPAGQNWRPYLEKSLSEARCVLVVWSSASTESWMVREETEFARHRGLPIVPVLLDGVEPPLGFREIQAADLTGWDGRGTSPRLLKLLHDLDDILRSAGPAAVPAVARGHEGNRHEGRRERSEALPSACLRTLSGHGGAVNALAFDRNSRLLASGGADRTIRIWYLESEEVHAFTGHAGAVRAVAFSPDGRAIASGSADGTVRIWEVRTGHVQRTVTHEHGVTSIGFSPDGRLVALGGCSGGGVVKLYATDGGEVREWKQGGWLCAVHSVAFSPDGRTLAVGDRQSKIKFWDVETGRELRTLVGHGAGGFWADLLNLGITVAFSPDGRLLASGSPDHTVKLWDTETGRELRTLRHNGYVQAIAFSPSGDFIVTGGAAEPSLKLWEVAGGSELRALGHKGAVHAVAFSLDGRLLASGGGDATVRLWG